MSVAYIKSLFVPYEAKELYYVVLVVKRLSDTHHHHV